MNESPISFITTETFSSFTISPTIVWVVILVALLVFTLMSIVIIYHWVTYSYSPKVTAKAVFVYAIGAGILVLTTLASAGVYTLSL
jgi:uncharacterized membrane protein YqjE